MATDEKKFRCLDCGMEFSEPYEKPDRLVKCPKCGSPKVVRTDIPAEDYGRGFYGRGCGCCGCRGCRGCGGFYRRW
ncbi:MAG: hypothetical protein GWP10_22455 [Nitrospiraceae bacterium]|nr:hypothetical protein [Nitrospiraceae bacterium]